MKTAFDVSLVIVNWNAEDYLRGCLLSLPDALGNLSYEIIIIDNASSDNSVQMLRTEFPSVRLIVSSRNEGLGKANEIGFRASSGSIVAFCNPDIVPGPRSLEILVEYLREQRQAGMVGPAIQTPREEREKNAIESTGLSSALSRLLASLSGRSTPLPGSGGEGADTVVRCFTVHGCCMVCSRKAIEKIGGFPTTTFLYGEEMLVGSLLKRAGYEVWWHSGASVLHHTGSSVNQRWSWVERNRIRRLGIVEAVRATRSRPYFQIWNLGKLIESAVRLASTAESTRRQLARTLIGLHVRAIAGRGRSALAPTDDPRSD